MNKIVQATLLSTLLMSGLQASDLLYKSTGGILSDSSVGVRQLNIDEMNKVRGGYEIVTQVFNNQGFAIAVAWPRMLKGFLATAYSVMPLYCYLMEYSLRMEVKK